MLIFAIPVLAILVCLRAPLLGAWSAQAGYLSSTLHAEWRHQMRIGTGQQLASMGRCQISPGLSRGVSEDPLRKALCQTIFWAGSLLGRQRV